MQTGPNKKFVITLLVDSTLHNLILSFFLANLKSFFSSLECEDEMQQPPLTSWFLGLGWRKPLVVLLGIKFTSPMHAFPVSASYVGLAKERAEFLSPIFIGIVVSYYLVLISQVRHPFVVC